MIPAKLQFVSTRYAAMINTSNHSNRRSHSSRVSWNTTRLEQRLLLAGDLGTTAIAAEPALTAVPDSLNSDSHEPSRIVVFVDSEIPDSDILLNSIPADAEFVLLNTDTPLLAQLSSSLAGRDGVQQIHVVTHGSPGRLHLGNQVIDVATLHQQVSHLRDLAKVCASDADLMFYGCNAGQNNAGVDFVRAVATLTGLDVAASNNRTGSGAQGSDWILETKSGLIESNTIFDQTRRQHFGTVLNVTVNAAGSTGEEIAQLLIDDSVVAEWTASTALEPFVYETNQTIHANQVKVRFANDLSLPQQGIDRNLVVESIQIESETFQTNDPETYSTGVWIPGEGVTPGFGLGQTLHTNGVFQYAADEPLAGINFAGRNWSTNPGTSAELNDGLEVRADGSDGSLWSFVDVKGGDRVQLSVTGSRFGIDGTLQSNLDGAGVGLDFFNAEGVEIGEAVFEIDAIGSPFSDQFIEIPDGTAYGTIFVWVADDNPSNDTLIRIIDLQLNQVPTGDTTPPAIEFLNDEQIFETPTEGIELLVRFTDENQIISSGATLEITDPAGDVRAVSASFEASTASNERTAKAIYAPDPFSPSTSAINNGVYTVSIRSGSFNSVQDAAGNLISDQTIGSFTIALPESSDVVPPEITFDALQNQSITGPAPPRFTVTATDNESGLAARNLEKAVRITGPNGYDRLAIFTNTTASSDLIANYIIDVFSGSPALPGEYQISIDGSAFRDVAGNEPSSGVIGTITLIA